MLLEGPWPEPNLSNVSKFWPSLPTNLKSYTSQPSVGDPSHSVVESVSIFIFVVHLTGMVGGGAEVVTLLQVLVALSCGLLVEYWIVKSHARNDD